LFAIQINVDLFLKKLIFSKFQPVIRKNVIEEEEEKSLIQLKVTFQDEKQCKTFFVDSTFK
jgi:hypothetical protein